MRQFPTIVVLKDGTEIETDTHELINWHHANVTSCNIALNENLKANQTANIYVMEETGKVFAETPDGRTFEFYGKV